jgi:predicted RNase H-like HicB family nuclease
MRNFIALIHKDRGSDYGVSFPDLPGVATAGVDLDDARRMAAEALALHLDGMTEDGEPIPEPSSLETVMADRENRDGVAILVEAPREAAKTVRANVTFPEDELARIDRFAEQHGMTRAGFLLHAAKQAMTARAAPRALGGKLTVAAPETFGGPVVGNAVVANAFVLDEGAAGYRVVVDTVEPGKMKSIREAFERAAEALDETEKEPGRAPFSP